MHLGFCVVLRITKCYLFLPSGGGGRGGFKGGVKVAIEPHRHEGEYYCMLKVLFS